MLSLAPRDIESQSHDVLSRLASAPSDPVTQRNLLFVCTFICFSEKLKRAPGVYYPYSKTICHPLQPLLLEMETFVL